MKKNNPDCRQRFFVMSEIRVTDGDTLRAVIHLPFGTSIRAYIRLRGWWAPEREGVSQAQGDAAAKKLEKWLEGREVFLFCPGAKLDRHGRTLGHLWWNGAIIDPRTVLGVYQLSREEHDRIREMNGHHVTSKRMRPYGGMETMHLQALAMSYVNQSTPMPTELIKELEERELSPPVLSGPDNPERSESEDIKKERHEWET